MLISLVFLQIVIVQLTEPFAVCSCQNSSAFQFIYFCNELHVIYPVIDLHVYVVFVVAEDVISKPDLTLEGATLEASPDQDVWDRKTIEVCGLEPSTTDDAILLFFESNRCSGGGEVDKVQHDMDKTVALVTFKNSGG